MTNVVATDEFIAWYRELSDSASEDVNVAIELLELRGTTLGFPYSSAIIGATFALRELRVQSSGKPIRIFYAFDPRRQAVLLVGGDKTGNKRFYVKMIRQCERIWKECCK